MTESSASTAAAGRAVVALSGGVDSAAAALLLQRAGFDVHGLYMHNWDDDDAYCSSAQDYQDARHTSEQLGIPLHRVDFSTDYRERVFAAFLAEYRAGRTPNPDIACNREIKFGLCRDYARRLGGNLFATGHYARLERLADGPALHKAADSDKDQSYFLAAVARADFVDVLFPLAGLRKPEVRELVRQAGLSVCTKPDSTGICFIGERPFRDFLARYVPEDPGPIESSDGRVLGSHRGLAFYTLGQRSGLGIGGLSGRAAEPWFVARKVPERNLLVVMQAAEYQAQRCRRVALTGLNWLAQPLAVGLEVNAKLRYRQADQAARVLERGEDSLTLDFAVPQRAVTPGQFAVLYQQDRCLGGGTIAYTL